MENKTQFAAMKEMFEGKRTKVYIFPKENGGTIRVSCNDEMIDFIFDTDGAFKYTDARDPWH